MADIEVNAEWFPMRVTYQQEVRVKQFLDTLGVVNFLPMHHEIVIRNGKRHYESVPLIHNLIFLHSTQEAITELKMHYAELSPLRYIMKRPSVLGKHTHDSILRVPQRQMDSFIRVASAEADRVIFLDRCDFALPPSTKVKIINGEFTGVEGHVKRIQKNKRVVVQLDGLAAVAIAYVPMEYLVYENDKQQTI